MLHPIPKVDYFKLITASKRDNHLPGTLRDIVLLAIYFVRKPLIAIEAM